MKIIYMFFVLVLSACSMDNKNFYSIEGKDFLIKYPNNWKIEYLKRGYNSLTIKRIQESNLPTDNILDTDFARISVYVINNDKLDKFIPSISDLYIDSNGLLNKDEQDNLLRLSGELTKINEKALNKINWKTELTNGMAIYFLHGDNIILFKMIYGDKNKKQIESDFYKIVSSLRRIEK